MTDTATELQRFPIGRFQRREHYTADERAAHIARLAMQPARLAAAVAALSPAQVDAPYRPGGWTVRQLVHHLADSHLNAYVRLRLGLTEDEPTIKPYDQDAWVHLPDIMRVPPQVSLSLFEAVHTRLVATLEGTPEAAFARAIVHPENGRMSLDQLVALYAWHGDHHIAHVEAVQGG